MNSTVIFPLFKKRIHVQVMVCSNCGMECDEDTKECAICFARFDETEQPRMV